MYSFWYLGVCSIALGFMVHQKNQLTTSYPMNTISTQSSSLPQLDDSPMVRFGFFFIGVYCILYCLSGQFITAVMLNPFWDLLVPKFAAIFGEEHLARTRRTGSGDLLFNYYKIAFFVFLAFLSAIALTARVKKETTFSNIKIGAFMLVKYFVIYQMIMYGMAKVFYMQFQYPSTMRLEQKLGDMSPMGLLWTFMGYSKGYTMFTGWLELIAGVFILFRRTMTLGLLMAFGVMLNVMMLNFCYDVPVKLLSSHIVFLSLVLLIPAGKSIWQYFLGTGDIARPSYPLFDYKNAASIFIGAKVLFLVLYLGGSAIRMMSYDSSKKFIFGQLNDVTQFRMYDSKGAEVTDITSDRIWESVTESGSDYLSIKTKNDLVIYRKMEVDSSMTSITLSRPGDNDYTFQLENVADGVYDLRGTYEGDSISMRWIQNHKEYQLESRPFRWVQEYPFNR